MKFLVTSSLVLQIIAIGSFSGRVHAGIREWLTCARSLSRSANVDRIRLLRWLDDEVATALGPDWKVVVDEARPIELFRVGELRSRLGSLKASARLTSALNGPRTKTLEMEDDYTIDWASGIWRPRSPLQHVRLIVYGDDFRWRGDESAPIEGQFTLAVKVHSLMELVPNDRLSDDPLPNLIAAAQSESLPNVTLKMVRTKDGYSNYYLRLPANGAPTERLRKTLKLARALEDRIVKQAEIIRRR